MSIAHRIAGVLLFLSLPMWLYLLDLSLQSEAGFDQVKSIMQSGLLLPVYAVLLWALMHHLLAGVRYLLLDVDIGIGKPAYRRTALAVMVFAPLVVILTLVVI